MTRLQEITAAVAGCPALCQAIEDDIPLAEALSEFVVSHLPGAGAEPEFVSRINRGRQPGFWLFLPFATAADFPNVAHSDTRRLAVASAIGILYNAWLDALLDTREVTALTILVTERIAGSLQRCLHELFPARSPFWPYFEACYDEFLAALLEERQRHADRQRPYAYADYCRLARGKMAMAMVNPIGLAVLDDSLRRLPDLVEAWNALNTAVVIFDDIKDWPADFQQGNITYLLAQALAGSAGRELTLDEVTYRVAASGIRELLYVAAAGHLQRAVESAHQARAPELASLAQQRRDMFLEFRRHLIDQTASALWSPDGSKSRES
jgi:hypothetical protein